jgi:adenylylsulfate kinase
MPKGFTVWLTGMSGAGKTTVAALLAERLRAAGLRVEVLDGDVVRGNLSPNLGFTRADREDNIKRIGFVCELLSRNGVATIAAVISPYREARDAVRARIPEFLEVHMDCPLEVLIERDVKGLYRKALAGEIENFTGVSDPYEPPTSPEVVIDSSGESAEHGVDRIWAKLQDSGLIAGS